MPVGSPKESLRAQSWMTGPRSLSDGAQLVEEHVGGDLERARERQRAEDGVARVLELAAAVAEHARVVEHRARGDDPVLHRGEGRDRLERRAGRIARGDRAVEQRRALVLGVQPLVGLLVDRLGEQVRVEARVGAEREDLAVARVHGDVGAGLGRVEVAVGGVDRPGQRVVGGALEAEVERELELAALERRHAGRLPRVVAGAHRVDDHAGEAVRPAQVGVVGLLDAVLADARPLLEAAVALLVELLRRDLAQGAEELGAQLVVRVVAQVLLLDDDAGELVAVLEQEVEGLGRDVGLDRHVRAGLVGQAGDDAAVDRPAAPGR